MLHACSVLSDSLLLNGLYPARFLCTWNFPGKNAVVGYNFLLQGIFLTQVWKCHSMSPELAGEFLTIELPGKPQMLLCYYDSFIYSKFTFFLARPHQHLHRFKSFKLQNEAKKKIPFSLFSLAALGQISLNTFVYIESL